MKVDVPPKQDNLNEPRKNESNEAARRMTGKEVIAFLASQFPNCFSIQGESKPLKIGIFDELAERLKDNPSVSKTQLRVALRQYTNSWRYLKATQEGVERVDLEGAAAGLVEAQHAQHAQETLAASKARAQERRKKRQQKARADREVLSKKNEGEGEGEPVRGQATQPRDSKQTPPKKQRRHRVKEATSNNPIKTKGKVNPDTLKLGTQVALNIGKKPVIATLKTLDKQEAQVQLDTGLVIKVALSELKKF